jgi:pyruvate-ferredoxin/flavodoxin oxidoreductase
VVEVAEKYFKEATRLTGRFYAPFVYEGDPKADKVIIAMGSVCETASEVVAEMNKKGAHVGLVKVHLYRPFSSKLLSEAIPASVKKIAVLDRTKEPGSEGEPLYLDVVAALPKKAASSIASSAAVMAYRAKILSRIASSPSMTSSMRRRIGRLHRRHRR